MRACKTEESAIATAERLGQIRADVVAFSQEVETDAYDTPIVLLEIGRIPPGLFE